MTDAVADDLDVEEELDETEGEPAKRRLSGKKLVLYVVLPLLLLTGGVTGSYLAGLLDPLIAMVMNVGASEEEGASKINKETTFFDLPELVVNLNTGGKQSSYLKISIALELDDPSAIPRLNALMPRIIDRFQVYLRELRREDLNGSAGLYRLKEELLLRVNAAVQPSEIRDVLFKEFIVQ